MLRKQLRKIRSKRGIIRSAIDVNTWRAKPPTVDEVRPAHCVACKVASRVVGEPLSVHGHGTVERQINGPPAPNDKPRMLVVVVRRFQCQRCRAVMTVVPREVLHGVLYAASAVGLALFLYGVEGLSARAVRARLSLFPAQDASTPGWPTLRRWISRAESLWRLHRAPLPNASTRRRAERVAMELVAHAQIADEAVIRVFDGAVHAP